VAVTQISKIQVRRGRKNQTIDGAPQLSSGEFGWIIDTQELYIGNGSVAEGAPAVGSTRILTENTNIIALASSYQFAYDVPLIANHTIPRPLGEKIDEIQVSVKDFGAVGDGEADDTVAFQRALDDLFGQGYKPYQKILVVPNGSYLIENIDIPNNSIIRGETRNGSMLITTATSMFDLVEKNNVSIENITIKNETISNDLFLINGLTNSKFVDVTVTGTFDFNNPQPQNLTFVVKPDLVTGVATAVNNVEFNNCIFESLGTVFDITQNTGSVSKVVVKSCYFFNVYQAFDINNESLSPINNRYTITDTEFEEVFSYTIRAKNLSNVLISECQFKNCSNGNQTPQYPVRPIVLFDDDSSRNNVVVDCTSNRQQLAAGSMVVDETREYVAEVENASRVNFLDRNQLTVISRASKTPIIALSGKNSWYTLQYHLNLGNFYRHGELMISPFPEQNHVAVFDQYQVSSAFLKTGRTFIIRETLDFIKENFPTLNYDKTLCERDIGLIIDALGYDLMFGSNYRTISAARSYFRKGAELVIQSQKAATLAAYAKLKELAKESVNSQLAQASIDDNMNLLINIVNNGVSVIPPYVIPTPTSGSNNASDAGYLNARNNIQINRTFIIEEVIASITNQLVYDELRCREDLDFILDALYYDLTYGGNLETIVAANAYFSKSTPQLGSPNEKTATLLAYQYLSQLVETIALDQAVTPTKQLLVSQTLTGNAGSAAAAQFASERIQEIRFFIENNGFISITVLFPDATWVPGALFISNVELQGFGKLFTSFEFSADFRKTGTGPDTDSIIVNYRNPFVENALGILSFDVSYGSNTPRLDLPPSPPPPPPVLIIN